MAIARNLTRPGAIPRLAADDASPDLLLLPSLPFFSQHFESLNKRVIPEVVIERYEDRSEREILPLNRVVRVFFF